MENKRISRIILSILNLIGFLGTIIINGLANTLPLNNKTTGALSDYYPNLFVPAALTFSIWGVIYILLAIFVVYSLIIALRRDAKGFFINRIGILFFLTCLANIGWIFSWHYQMVLLSLVFMLILFGCLLAIYLRLSIGKSDATKKEKYIVHVPFSVYLGWITIATIANVTAVLVNAKWNTFGLGEPFWTVVVLVVGIAITIAMLLRRKDIFYCLVVDWALLGILIKRLSVSAPPDPGIVATTIIGLVLISIGIIVQIVRRKVY
jgi:hypothetical protein